MKRVIVTAPEGANLEALSPEQRLGLEAVVAQWVQPMPGTVPAAGRILIDAVMRDNFDPAAIAELGLPFEVLGLWQWDGAEVTELVPLEGFTAYLPERVFYDSEGNVTGTLPALPVLPHSWAGWPGL